MSKTISLSPNTAHIFTYREIRLSAENQIDLSETQFFLPFIIFALHQIGLVTNEIYRKIKLKKNVAMENLQRRKIEAKSLIHSPW